MSERLPHGSLLYLLFFSLGGFLFHDKLLLMPQNCTMPLSQNHFYLFDCIVCWYVHSICFHYEFLTVTAGVSWV
jgi:hypothetical protein